MTQSQSRITRNASARSLRSVCESKLSVFLNFLLRLEGHQRRRRETPQNIATSSAYKACPPVTRIFPNCRISLFFTMRGRLETSDNLSECLIQRCLRFPPDEGSNFFSRRDPALHVLETRFICLIVWHKRNTIVCCLRERRRHWSLGRSDATHPKLLYKTVNRTGRDIRSWPELQKKRQTSSK
jgi:hypothetical protein